MNIYDGCPIYHEDFHTTPIIKTTSKTHTKKDTDVLQHSASILMIY